MSHRILVQNANFSAPQPWGMAVVLYYLGKGSFWGVSVWGGGEMCVGGRAECVGEGRNVCGQGRGVRMPIRQ